MAQECWASRCGHSVWGTLMVKAASICTCCIRYSPLNSSMTLPAHFFLSSHLMLPLFDALHFVKLIKPKKYFLVCCWWKSSRWHWKQVRDYRYRPDFFILLFVFFNKWPQKGEAFGHQPSKRQQNGSEMLWFLHSDTGQNFDWLWARHFRQF